MIGRLASQKGFDLLEEILPDLMELSVNLIMLGTGDAAIDDNIRKMEKLYPDRLKVIRQFNEEMAHMIEAGADIFLMPSRYEPCGLNQMYSLRYGTIPVVHATGGLYDSVSDVNEYPDSGTGFKFHQYESDAFLEAIKSALELFRDNHKWIEIQKRAMVQDFSWEKSALKYIEVYEETLKVKQRRQALLKMANIEQDADVVDINDKDAFTAVSKISQWDREQPVRTLANPSVP